MDWLGRSRRPKDAFAWGGKRPKTSSRLNLKSSELSEQSTDLSGFRQPEHALP